MGFLLPRVIPPARFLDIPERLFSLKRSRRNGGVDGLIRSLRNHYKVYPLYFLCVFLISPRFPVAKYRRKAKLVARSYKYPKKINPLKKIILALVLAAGLTAFTSRTSAQNLIQNGDFAAGSFTSWNVSGNASIQTYWNGSLIYNPRNTTYPFASISGATLDSRHFAEFINGRSILSQTFSTIVGQTYNVSFLGAGNDDRGVDHFYATVGTNNFVNYGMYAALGKGVSAKGDVDDWKTYTTSFIADSTSTTLTFDVYIVDNAYGVANVSVTSVPEPSTYALFGLAALALVIAYRRTVD